MTPEPGSNAMAPPIPARPARRRFRLSVRVLMLLVLALGGGLGWIAHRARVQREAVEVIRRAGGSVGYNRPWSSGATPISQPKPPGPPWLRRLLGPDYFDTATSVHFSEVTVNPLTR